MIVIEYLLFILSQEEEEEEVDLDCSVVGVKAEKPRRDAKSEIIHLVHLESMWGTQS